MRIQGLFVKTEMRKKCLKALQLEANEEGV